MQPLMGAGGLDRGVYASGAGQPVDLGGYIHCGVDDRGAERFGGL